MACSVRTQKITLQIISSFHLLSGLLAIALAIYLIVEINETTVLTLDSRSKIDYKTALYICCYHLIKGTLMAIISIFGIYSVAKENAKLIKHYCIIHVFLIVLYILALVSNFSIVTIVSFLLSFSTVYWSYELEQTLTKRPTAGANTV